MKQIELHGRCGKGKYALVDELFYPQLNTVRWIGSSRGYAITGSRKFDGKPRTIFMHRIITNAPDGLEVDHINHNELDNRLSNLRVVSHQQNSLNRTGNKKNKSGYKGLRWHLRDKVWEVRIGIGNKKYVYGGRSTNLNKAALMYNKVAKKYFGEYAYLNKVSVSDGGCSDNNEI